MLERFSLFVAKLVAEGTIGCALGLIWVMRRDAARAERNGQHNLARSLYDLADDLERTVEHGADALAEC